MGSSRLRNSLIDEVSLMSSFVELLLEDRAAKKNKIKYGHWYVSDRLMKSFAKLLNQF